MPAINVDLDYFEHFKTKRLVVKFGEGAELIPIKLWVFAAKFYPEKGIFKGIDDQELLSLAGIKYNKDASSILQGLVDLGFLDRTKGGYQIHEWEEYQGHIIAYKIRGKKANEARWNKLKPKLEPLTPSEQEKAWAE